MGLAIAPNSLQMHGILHLAGLVLVDGVAGLMGSFVDPESPATKREHLRHERQSLKLSVSVERLQNLVLAANFNPVARP
jgi:hypothetical protein